VGVTPSDVVDEQIAAYAAGDIERFVALYASDAACYELPSLKPIAEGRDQIRKVWSAVFAKGPRSVRILNRITTGEMVIDQERITGPEQVVEAVAIYGVRGPLIERVWFPTPVSVRPIAASAPRG